MECSQPGDGALSSCMHAHRSSSTILSRLELSARLDGSPYFTVFDWRYCGLMTTFNCFETDCLLELG